MITKEDKQYLEEFKKINENLTSLINRIEGLYTEIETKESFQKMVNTLREELYKPQE